MQKIAICTPTVGFSTCIEWAAGLNNLVKPEGTNFWYIKNAPVGVGRNALVEISIEKGVERIFFVDHDVVPPPNALMELIALQDRLGNEGDVVAGLYFAWLGRWNRIVPIVGSDDETTWTPDFSAHLKSEPYQADTVGMGCTLIRVPLFEKISKPWFRMDDIQITEDVFFCRKLRKIGIRPWIHPGIVARHYKLGFYDSEMFKPDVMAGTII